MLVILAPLVSSGFSMLQTVGTLLLLSRSHLPQQTDIPASVLGVSLSYFVSLCLAVLFRLRWKEVQVKTTGKE